MLLDLQLIVHILINNEGKYRGWKWVKIRAGRIDKKYITKNSIDIEHIVVRG